MDSDGTYGDPRAREPWPLTKPTFLAFESLHRDQQETPLHSNPHNVSLLSSGQEPRGRE
jgi:hypothetical protein